jgi:hypothetical protein
MIRDRKERGTRTRRGRKKEREQKRIALPKSTMHLYPIIRLQSLMLRRNTMRDLEERGTRTRRGRKKERKQKRIALLKRRRRNRGQN